MTVEPGFGAQKFMADKVGECHVLRERFPHLQLEVTIARLSSQYWYCEWKDSRRSALMIRLSEFMLSQLPEVTYSQSILFLCFCMFFVPTIDMWCTALKNCSLFEESLFTLFCPTESRIFMYILIPTLCIWTTFITFQPDTACCHYLHFELKNGWGFKTRIPVAILHSTSKLYRICTLGCNLVL